MPHLLRLSFKHGPPKDDAPFPFSVPQIRSLPELNLNAPITFFVGENGSGKSTLLEGIAAAAELPAMGGTRDVARDPTLEHARRLGAALRLAWTRRSRQGFFLRAEDFFGRLKSLAREDARESRERIEAATGLRADAPRPVAAEAIHPDEHDIGSFIKRHDGRSHGESFMDLFNDHRDALAHPARVPGRQDLQLRRMADRPGRVRCPRARRAHTRFPQRSRALRSSLGDHFVPNMRSPASPSPGMM